MNPETVNTGCQLNSAAPPSQAKPFWKCRTHLSTKMTEIKPMAAAADRTTRNCFGLSIAFTVGSSAGSSAAAATTITFKRWPTGADRGHVNAS